MLSISQCRKHLKKGSNVSDVELEQLRNHLYQLADIAINAFVRGKDNKEEKKIMLTDIQAERAAIMEFDGKIDKDTAERHAFSINPQTGQ